MNQLETTARKGLSIVVCFVRYNPLCCSEGVLPPAPLTTFPMALDFVFKEVGLRSSAFYSGRNVRVVRACSDLTPSATTYMI